MSKNYRFYCGIGPVWSQNYRFQSFSGFALRAGQITGISLKVMNSSKEVLKMTIPALSRINSVVILARTVHS